YGMAASQFLQPDAVEFTSPIDGGKFLRTRIEPDKDSKVPEINYGDIARIDLFRLIRDEYAITLADLEDADLNINWENIEVGGAAQAVKDARGFLLTAEREDGFASAQAAGEKSYKGQQAVDSDLGKTTLSNSGIIFLAPTIDVDRLRQGKTLLARDISITLKGYDKNDPEKRLLLKLRVVDYARAPDTVFFGDRPLNNPGYHSFEPAAATFSAKKSANNDLLDVWRVEQRLKYLGYGLSSVNTGEITVNGMIDDAERIALRQFDQTVDGKTEYVATVTETVKAKGKKKTVTKPLPPVTLTSDDVAWLNAYNAPHWLNFFPSGKQQLLGWENKTDLTKPKEAMGTSWIYDLMLAGQEGNKTSDGKIRAKLWYSGTNTLGTILGLGIREDYISKNNQQHISGKDVINGIIPRTPPPTITNVEAYARNQWDYENAKTISSMLFNNNLNNFDVATRTFGNNPSNGTPQKAQANKQNEALLDFVAVYASTQRNGTRESTKIANGDAETIRTSLFGDGSSTGSIIDSEALLIGGVSLQIGSQMTAESLGRIMGNINGVNYNDWLEPIQNAMLEFEITTPQRIAAFLAQVKQESGGMRHIIESFNYSQAGLANTFSYLRTHNARDATGNTRTLAQLWGRQLGEATIPHDRQVRIANTVYSSEAIASLGNGNIASGDGWLFRGRGLKQITGRANYQAFADYLTDHPIAGQPTGTELMSNPELLSSNRYLAARSAGWFWRIGSSAGNLNTRADGLDLSKSDTEMQRFRQISYGIGRKSPAERWEKYKRNVDLVQTGGNPYENLTQALTRLGFSTSGKKSYEDRFGIVLRPPSRQELSTQEPIKASAEKSTAATVSSAITALPTTYEYRTTTTETHLNFPLREHNMFTLDFTDYLASNNHAATIAQVQTAEMRTGNTLREMGICHVVPNVPEKRTQTKSGTYPAQQPVFPYTDVSFYFLQYEDRDIRKWYGNAGPFDQSSVSVTQAPTHGVLLPAKCEEHRAYCEHKAFYYKPTDGFFGDDSAVIDAKVNGLKVRLRYYFHAIDATSYSEAEVCKSSGGYRNWKISQWPTDVENKSLFEQQESGLLAGGPTAGGDVSVTYEDLSGAMLAQVTTHGANIQMTLDNTAAGHGWFIDLTPSDNTEYLPTSNPFEWIARPDSDADGKMDLMTVLLHEYGHAAGLDHSADSHGLMASTLLPGVRRLPSSTELAALRHFLADSDSAPTPYEPSTPPGAPLPLSRGLQSWRTSRLRPSDRTDLDEPDRVAPPTQFSILANATLENQTFSSATGWTTTGDVLFEQGGATLRETATTQTRLNQVFVLGANDRTLAFTLTNITLDNLDAAPNDAFDVALVDATTGQSLLGGIGLANSDAILNLQADGSEHKAAGVSTVRKQDGSLSVTVDLAGIAAGTVVNLAFDLIGFGRGLAAASSQVTISSLQLGSSASPEARDDHASTAEDVALTIDVTNNDRGADPI
ncbi:MAG: matrixin family metalloprotease, partial [Candidatus Accumulibacter sp.]|nr:matrixin family metalloprotease [Accumulibacter sp.]